ncbi:unnamed protein product [Effrenium voratum]|nr:unnamed protein product [Effrenium voratum]
MTKGQFFELGCPNCRELDMQENENRVYSCTSPNYSGFFSMVTPGAFASRFNGLERRMPGCYALIVHGRLPDFTADDEDYEPEEADTPNGDTPNGDASSAAAGSRRGKSRAGVSDNTPSAEHAVSEHTESDEASGRVGGSC